MSKKLNRPFPEKTPGQLQRWNKTIWHRMRAAGLLPQSEFRRPGQLPPELCQLNAARVRKLLKVPGRWIDERHRRGKYDVFFVTIVRPEGMFRPGTLAPEAVAGTKKWVARRLRKLSSQCRYAAIGVVDICFNDGRRVGEPSMFSVHAHVLVAVKNSSKLDGVSVLHWAFNPGSSDHDCAPRIRVPVMVKPVQKGEVRKVRGYIGKAFFPLGNHHRVSKFESQSKDTHDRPLNLPQLFELLGVLRHCPPERRIIYSGFHQRSGGLVRTKQTHALSPRSEFLAKEERRVPQGPISDDEYYGT